MLEYNRVTGDCFFILLHNNTYYTWCNEYQYILEAQHSFGFRLILSNHYKKTKCHLGEGKVHFRGEGPSIFWS